MKSLGWYLQEEMTERGWTARDVAMRMGGETAQEIGLDQLCLEMTLAVPESHIDQETADKLGRAFDVSPETFLNLDNAYLASPALPREEK